MNFDFLHELITSNQSKIVMLVLDGLGGLPLEPGGKTELETAHTPHLDALAGRSSLGLSQPAGPGVTVESGPGHLALFGYDPLQYRIGRGVLEALGIGFALKPDDIAIRGNYCTLDAQGLITDRRAGRIPTETSKELSRLLTTRIEDVDIFVETVREHRLAIILRGQGLDPAVSDTDPLKNGYAPLTTSPLSPQAEKTAHVLNRFAEKAQQALASHMPQAPANMLLMRGIDRHPKFPAFPEIYGLRAAAIAAYPTYRGIAKLTGMTALPLNGSGWRDEFDTLEQHWDAFDFFYLHVKETDLAGEDGDFARKVHVIEQVDELLPRLTALQPDVIIVCGDHSTPAVFKAHSWHPVPFLICAHPACADGIPEFGESACRCGSLGVVPATHIMPLALANAGRLAKFGG